MLGCTLAKALCTLAQPCCIDEVSSCRLAVPQSRLLHRVPDVDVAVGDLRQQLTGSQQMTGRHGTAAQAAVICVLSTDAHRHYKPLQAKNILRRTRLGARHHV